MGKGGPPMERSLETESGILRYRCERKRVKNINVRIDREGQVLVSYPAGCPLSAVEAFLRQKSRWIARAQERMARRAAQAQQPRHVQTGERVELLGKPYTLRICQALPPVASEPDGPGLAWEGILFLKVEDPAREESRKAAFARFVDCCSARVFADANDQVAPLFAPLGVPRAEVRGRRMTARWGTCHTQKGQITLNKFLLHLPRQCLCGVLVHEYAHFLYPDHGERFWALVRHLDPQNPQTEALLRGYSPHF